MELPGKQVWDNIHRKAFRKKIIQTHSPHLRIPAPIMQGNKDPKVDPQSGKQIFQQIKIGKAMYKEINYHLHGVVRGIIAQRVFK